MDSKPVITDSKPVILKSSNFKDSKPVITDSKPVILKSSNLKDSKPVIRDSKPVILKSSNLKSYTFSDLSIATREFHSDAKLWQGDYYTCYKGYVDENTFAVAKWGTGLVTMIKRFEQPYSDSEELLTEINTSEKLCHPNIAKLIGYCFEKEHRLLVHEYPPRGNLDLHLRDSDPWPFSWKLRISIAHGVAKGLAYLHSPGVNVIHRDVRTSNILIDSEYNAKLSGFSLAMDEPEDKTSHVTTRVRGTSVYLDPYYSRTGKLSMKSDVYSFGVVLLELLTGLSAIDLSKAHQERFLPSSAESLPKAHQERFLSSSAESLPSVIISDMMIAHIEASSPASSLAVRCTSFDSKARPDAKQAAEELEQLLSFINSKDRNPTRTT